tara:strand:- start:3358 stop:4134 length:777 start_codon:yes stop_codon:yes gene_type:complete
MKQNNLKKIAENCALKLLETKNKKIFFSKPFKYCVIDNFLPTKIAESCSSKFPKLSDKKWEFSNENDIEIKYRSKWKSEFDIPDQIIDIVRIVNSSLILKAMSKIFRIPKLMPDPYYSGGGLNMTKKGGLLDVHVDGNYHDQSGLNRRLNLLIYFNKNWKKKYGGELCLYDKEGKKIKKKIEPIFNRCVIFNTHDTSYHGLPKKVNFPERSPRKSLILYYYTKERRFKKENVYDFPHSALWVKKGLKDKKGNKKRKYF